jgi:cytochrome b pre-mRNA-processing protein 3
LNPLDRLLRWRSGPSNNEKLYGAIVAQTRLPVFYRSFTVPDTVEGRFTLPSLHLFAVLHGLTREGSEGRALAQELVDRFSKDMETVLRGLGVSDVRIPKSTRGLAASSQSLLAGYEAAFATGEPSLAEAIKESLPRETANPELSSKALASYLMRCVNQLELQPLASLQTGALEFPEANEKP